MQWCRLTGSGNAHQSLKAISTLYTLGQFRYGLWLVTGRIEVGMYSEFAHR